jgi:hypothetical protein
VLTGTPPADLDGHNEEDAPPSRREYHPIFHSRIGLPRKCPSWLRPTLPLDSGVSNVTSRRIAMTVLSGLSTGACRGRPLPPEESSRQWHLCSKTL